jgi:hypothetical protein
MDTATILAELNKLAMQVSTTQSAQSGDLMATQERRGNVDETRQYQNTKHILDRVDSNGSQTHIAIERRGGENINQTVYESGEVRHNQEDLASRAATQMERATNELIEYSQDEAIRSTEFHGDNNYKLEELHADVGDYFKTTQNLVVATGTSIERQSAAQFAETQAGLHKVEGSLARLGDSHTTDLSSQATVNYGQVQIQALQLNNTMTKEMEECCCELKEKVASNEQNLTDLVYSNQADDLRLRLTTLAFTSALNRKHHSRSPSRSPSRSRSRGRSSSHHHSGVRT